jgi:hypothetical protein
MTLRRFFISAGNVRSVLFYDLVVKAEDQECWHPLTYEQSCVSLASSPQQSRNRHAGNGSC